jgi:steroid delta-isomerase-like uncharacterized protein
MRLTAIVVCGVALALAATSAMSMPLSATSEEATPSACPVTTETENQTTARRWFEEAINCGDLSVIDDIVAEDVVHHAGTFPDGEGADAIKGVLGALLAGFPDTRHTVEQGIANDDIVVIRWLAKGTHQGDFQGYSPSGEPVTWTGINIFRFECGRIAESWSEVDGLGRLRQLGVLGTPVP